MGLFGSDVEDIKVHWDSNPGRSFFPGETVKGRAVLKTSKDDVKIQKFTLTLYGNVRIEWSDVSTCKRWQIVIYL